jgi:hypothetical protein
LRELLRKILARASRMSVLAIEWLKRPCDVGTRPPDFSFGEKKWKMNEF